jgi:hypothetical protein
MDLLGPLVALMFLISPLVVVHVLARPFRLRSMGSTTYARRFTLIDFVALVAQFQVILTGCLWLARGGNTDAPFQLESLSFFGLGAIVVGALWWGGVESAARANISSWQRRLVLHFVVPGIAAEAVLTDACLMTVLAQLTHYNGEPHILLPLVLIGILILGGAILYALGAWVCRTPASEPVVVSPSSTIVER